MKPITGHGRGGHPCLWRQIWKVGRVLRREARKDLPVELNELTVPAPPDEPLVEADLQGKVLSFTGLRHFFHDLALACGNQAEQWP